MTLTEELAALLAELGLGTYTPTSPAGDIYAPVLPDQPDAAIAVARYGGADSTGRDYDTPRVQIRVRGAAGDARPVEERAQRVYDALHGLRRRLLPGGSWLVLCTARQAGPIYIGRDQNGRHEYVINLDCEIHRPGAHIP